VTATDSVPVLSGRTGPARTKPLTEREWQAQIVAIARTYGWHVHHHLISRGSEAGWMDLVIAGHDRVLFIELKTQLGKLRPEQITWLGVLAAAGCEVAVWRPADLDTVTAALGPRQTRLAGWSTS